VCPGRAQAEESFFGPSTISSTFSLYPTLPGRTLTLYRYWSGTYHSLRIPEARSWPCRPATIGAIPYAPFPGYYRG